MADLERGQSPAGSHGVGGEAGDAPTVVVGQPQLRAAPAGIPDADRPGQTVSLDAALSRLHSAEVVLDPKDRQAIVKAIEWRNKITHFEFTLFLNELKATYALLFEFIHSFYRRELNTEITQEIAPQHRAKAAEIMEVFRVEFVTFDGIYMHRTWPRALLAAQEATTVWLNGAPYARYRYGDEPGWATSEYGDRPQRECHDCFCMPGQFHGPGCDAEVCPRCNGQFLMCDCEDDAEVPDDVVRASKPAAT